MHMDTCAGSPEAVRNSLLVTRVLFNALKGYDWRNEARLVRAPTLIIHGVLDPIPIESSREWASTLPNSRLLAVEHSRHFTYAERPDVFFPAVDTFLRGNWPK